MHVLLYLGVSHFPPKVIKVANNEKTTNDKKSKKMYAEKNMFMACCAGSF